MFQDIIEKYAHVTGYCGKCCQCFRILWKVQPMLHDIVGNAVNVGSIATVLGYEGKCCQCFRIL